MKYSDSYPQDKPGIDQAKIDLNLTDPQMTSLINNAIGGKMDDKTKVFWQNYADKYNGLPSGFKKYVDPSFLSGKASVSTMNKFDPIDYTSTVNDKAIIADLASKGIGYPYDVPPVIVRRLYAKGDIQKIKELTDAAANITPESQQGIVSKVLNKIAEPATAVLEKAAPFVFGSTGKTVGSLITNLEQDVQSLRGEPSIFKPTPKNTPLDIAFTALELYPGGGFVSDALKKLPGGEIVAKTLMKIPEGLREQAIKQYSEALGATTKGLKYLTKRVVEGTPAIVKEGVAGVEQIIKEKVPGLLERKQVITSLPNIEAKSAEMASQAGAGIKAVEEAIPATMQSETGPILEKLAKLKNTYMVEGKAVNQSAVNAVQGVEDTIKQFGDKISTQSIIKVRRILDDSVDAGGGFIKDKITNLSDKAEKSAADAIRGILAEDVPDLTKLNAEFNLWQNVNKITTETLSRRSTQTKGLFRAMAVLGGGITGLIEGQGISDKLQKGALYAAGGEALVRGFRSPLYKTLSAITKNEIANQIIKGNLQAASVILLKAIGGLKNLVTGTEGIQPQ